MNSSLQEINEIIMLCDKMIDFVNSKGIIRYGNSLYKEYKEKISAFVKKHELLQHDYAPYEVLRTFYYTTTTYSLNMNETEMIRRTVVEVTPHKDSANQGEKK